MYNNYNPYFIQPQPQIQRVQPIEQNVQPINNQPYLQPLQVTKPLGLLGKSVDSIEVVKATDIPLDGSISYFPLTDGSAIVTKQLKADGTSKTIVYKPIQDTEETVPMYVTIEELDKRFNEINFDDIDDLKEEFKDIKKDIKDLKTRLKNKGD